MILCALFGALMISSKEIMAALPNIHLLGLLIMLTTLTFRFKALISIYIYVFAEALFQGFSPWWVPNLYTWAILWAVTMLIPKKLPTKAKMVIYPIVCSLHGFAYGILCAPTQALFFGLDFNGMIAWIITGFPFDIIHGISNFCAGLLVLPLYLMLSKMLAKIK
ncbi:MAG: hypothetical protein IJD71_00235 [Clostridia bacterium]|nr:hypothetical protein [Clostridia bacterium]MBQ9920059.1 hypothetical protein [Clostridia bacterium]